MSNEQSDSPTAWFCVMEAAIRRGDREAELQARRELARLGVLVVIDARSVLAKRDTVRKAGGS